MPKNGNSMQHSARERQRREKKAIKQQKREERRLAKKTASMSGATMNTERTINE
jgi:hypothetical protein